MQVLSKYFFLLNFLLYCNFANSQSYKVDTVYGKDQVATGITINKKTNGTFKEVKLARRTFEIYVDNSIFIDNNENTAYIISALISSPAVGGKMPLTYSIVRLELEGEKELFRQSFSLVVGIDHHYKFKMENGLLHFFFNGKEVKTIDLKMLENSGNWWEVVKSKFSTKMEFAAIMADE